MYIQRDSWTGASPSWNTGWTMTTVSGVAVTFSAPGSTGRMRQPTTSATNSWAHANADINIQDGEIFAVFNSVVVGTTAPLLEFAARWDGNALGSANCYLFQVWPAVFIGKINISKYVGGVNTVLVAGLQSGMTLPFNVKVQCIGSTIRAKSWNGAEPAWGTNTSSVTDSSITGDGRWAVGANMTSTTAGTSIDIADNWVDNFLPAQEVNYQSKRSLITR